MAPIFLGPRKGLPFSSPTHYLCQHGQFDVGNGQIVYQDLGSQNGSFVSEQPIAQAQPVALSAGHIFQAGSIHFQLVDDPNAVESMKRETAVISNTPKAIEPGDFGSADPSASPSRPAIPVG